MSAEPTAAVTEQTGTASASARRPGPFAPLRSRNFSLLFWGQLISALGDQAYILALPWTVLLVTGDPGQMAVVLAASGLTRVLFLLIGGALADRLNPRVVMLAADLGRAAVVAALGITLFVGLPPLWVIALLAGLQGVGSGLFNPGSLAILPRVVDGETLPAANGLMQVAQFVSQTLGPLLGGIATAQAAIVAFLADAASFLVSALTLFGMRLPKLSTSAPATNAGTDETLAAPTQKSHLLREIGAGMRYALHTPLLRTALGVTVLGNVALSGTLGVALVVLIEQMTDSALAFGVVTAAVGVGGILGGLGSALLGRLPHRGVVALVFWGMMAIIVAAVPLAAGVPVRLPLGLDLTPLAATLGITTLGLTARVALIAVLLGVVGFFLAIGDTMFLTIMQQRIAPEYMARVFSVLFVFGGILQPVSLVVAGYLAATTGPGLVFIAGSAVFLCAVIIGLSSRQIRQM